MLGRLATALAVCSVLAVPAQSAVPQARTEIQTASMPFDPPLGEPIRYRWEKTVQQDGKTEMSWSTSDFTFEEDGDGYRLTIDPVSAGSNETDPEWLAVEQRLNELLDIPFVLRLNADVEIVELENHDLYWSTIIKVLREELGRRADSKGKVDAGAVEAVMRMFETMPAEARLGLLTEPVQPAVEFANVEIDNSEAISARIDSASPFGGTVGRDVVISLVGLKPGQAQLAIQSSVPQEEFQKVMQALLAQLGPSMTEAKRTEAEASIAAMGNIRVESTANYRVSTDNGLLDSMVSTETVEAGEGDERTEKVTTRSLTRVH